MTRVKASAALWLLFGILLLRAVIDAPAAAIQYDTTTGSIIQPTAGKGPAVPQSGAVTRTTDASYTVPITVNYITWSVGSQSASREIDLPEIGTGFGKFTPGRDIEIFIEDSNSEDVEVVDFAPATVATLNGGDRYVFHARSDGGWDALRYGTAATADIGTADGGNVPTLSQADGRYIMSSVNNNAAQIKYSNGQVLSSSGNLVGPGGNVIANALGDMRILRDLYDASNSNGAAGNVLTALGPGSGTAWRSNLLVTATTVQVGTTGSPFTAIRHVTGQNLSSGTVTVPDAAVATGDHIDPQGIGTTNAGFLTWTINSGVGYTITSSNGSDARALSIVIYEH